MPGSDHIALTDVDPSPAGSAVPPDARLRVLVLGVPVDAIGWTDVVQTVAGWAARGESRAVLLCNAHGVVTAGREEGMARAIERADLALPDGAPVAWLMSRRLERVQPRIGGPDLMLALCAHAERAAIAIYLYGGTDDTLQALQARLCRQYPALRIAGMRSPPYRPLNPDEADADVERLNRSGAGIVFVALGCPKQERWIDAQRGRVHAVMVGVGAAFDFHAGLIRRAPPWMREFGLEWLHRLASEPRRLWRRYLITNTAFICGAMRQLWSRRRISG